MILTYEVQGQAKVIYCEGNPKGLLMKVWGRN